MGLVPHDVRKSLEFMDWKSVSLRLVIRYLLMHTYKSMEENKWLYGNWRELLHRYVDSTSSLSVSSHVMQLAEGIADDTIASDTHEVQSISEIHIPLLAELLVGCAHKWEVISIALGLPESVRKDLRSRQDPDCIICFHQLLTKWILGSYKHAKKPTLQNLERVLKSNLVALGQEADKLQNLELIRDEQPHQ